MWWEIVGFSTLAIVTVANSWFIRDTRRQMNPRTNAGKMVSHIVAKQDSVQAHIDATIWSAVDSLEHWRSK
jgi:hypothetical protein